MTNLSVPEGSYEGRVRVQRPKEIHLQRNVLDTRVIGSVEAATAGHHESKTALAGVVNQLKLKKHKIQTINNVVLPFETFTLTNYTNAYFLN